MILKHIENNSWNIQLLIDASVTFCDPFFARYHLPLRCYIRLRSEVPSSWHFIWRAFGLQIRKQSDPYTHAYRSKKKRKHPPLSSISEWTKPCNFISTIQTDSTRCVDELLIIINDDDGNKTHFKMTSPRMGIQTSLACIRLRTRAPWALLSVGRETRPSHNIPPGHRFSVDHPPERKPTDIIKRHYPPNPCLASNSNAYLSISGYVISPM
jgi:hypothetical protein